MLSDTVQVANNSGPQFLIFKKWGLNYPDLESLYISPHFSLSIKGRGNKYYRYDAVFLLSVVPPPLLSAPPGCSEDLLRFFFIYWLLTVCQVQCQDHLENYSFPMPHLREEVAES